MTAPSGRGVHLVTDERLPFDQLCQVVDSAAEARVSVVQLRAKQAAAREVLAQARILATIIDERATLIINDRPDIAWAARREGIAVAGVHLGQNDIAPDCARDLLGANALVGWSAHLPQHLESLSTFPAGTVDYLGVGVVRATETKAHHPPELGVTGFADFAALAPLPCVAIGGVRVGDVPHLRTVGAAGVAVVSELCGAANPAARARELVAAFAGRTPQSSRPYERVVAP